MGQKRSLGVTVCGVALILISLSTTIKLLDFDYYRHLFQYLPQDLMLLRYIISWCDRGLEFVLGVGILCLKDVFRKILIFSRIFIIVTIQLKHPFLGLENHIKYLDQQGVISIKSFAMPGVSLNQLTWLAVLGACIFDIFLAAFLIYFFTRPKVKAQFH